MAVRQLTSDLDQAAVGAILLITAGLAWQQFFTERRLIRFVLFDRTATNIECVSLAAGKRLGRRRYKQRQRSYNGASQLKNDCEV
jgi:hypothetical protein